MPVNNLWVYRPPPGINEDLAGAIGELHPAKVGWKTQSLQVLDSGEVVQVTARDIRPLRSYDRVKEP